ncbi:polysaccharide biosynthesis protein [Mahella sp.]|uniref:putative polysaccharide biosynthesis protein n=1 Tax=Mahella sp. TaxID=2798721 RepID=UPI0025BC3ACF|nr:polysaccharide biosynthesis protein [Mahella sp.]MBZ4666541.1 polysaccharide biosynthesis protein [Mahella sp.]
MSRQTFLKGAAILGLAGLLVKIIGAFYRIPLAYIIGPEGMGLYQMAYPIYTTLLYISVAGIPTAISKMVAERIALGHRRDAHRVFMISFKLLLILGIITTVLLLLATPLLALYLKNQKSLYAFLAIAPSLFFVSMISAYRGYFQGMQQMIPTALSQIIEQLGKLIFGLWLASLWMPKGVQYGAMGAVLGVTISEVLAFAMLVITYNLKRRDIRLAVQRDFNRRYRESKGSILQELLKIAIPITIGGLVIPLVNITDLMIIPRRLAGLGLSTQQSTELYGYLTGYANTLVNFPQVITVALSASLVPAISEAAILKDINGLQEKANIAIRLTILLGLPSALGMAVLAQPILQLLYQTLTAEQLAISSQILEILAFSIIFLTLVQTSAGILQGVGKVGIPVINLLWGALLKIVMNYVLVGIPVLNIRGAAFGTIACYALAAVLDLLAVARYTHIKFNAASHLMKPAISAGVMIAAVWVLYKWLYVFLDSNSMATLLAILAGIIVYGLMLMAIGAVTYNDLRQIDRLKGMADKLYRMGMLR